MQDVITKIVNRYDTIGYYLDNQAMDQIKSFFDTGIKRIQIVETINNEFAKIIKAAYSELYDEQPELLRPGGNSYTTRRYSACLRDIEYYLRYSTYAIVSADSQVLDERVLYGLRDTYNSLSVPIAPTIRVIQLLQDAVLNEIADNDPITTAIISQPFQHLINKLSEKNI
uniref:allophycocyanin beta 18 subunit n=1 Tax=Glaucosphaera vacuolata TaxID=38265 RepID=UPI001FCDEE8F|nr:allophycocyanin beta 18 subunit [Glaucosphaera vacuolata]UNJ18600.1 allophycocyanin beta 18 subunit [Glaucosphaera vacuolata]